MLRVRKAADRGHANHGWLDSFHTFSFADYYDPGHMSFRALRVINEDSVAPGNGFPTHSHRDMEIITYVLDGAIEHKDSMGTGSTIRPGDVQRMSAGRGVSHSEYNPSKSDALHFLQIWIMPNVQGIAPEYEQKAFPAQEKKGNWRLVASHDGREGSLRVHQDMALHVTLLEKGERLTYQAKGDRHVWLQVARGAVRLTPTSSAARDAREETLRQGDGVAISEESAIALVADDASEILLFDLA